MKIAVTGGACFIGCHLVEKLVNERNNVVVLDNLSSGNLDNLAQFLQKIHFVNADVREKRKIFESLEGVDAVVHLAALTSVQESIMKHLLYKEVNANGTLNILNQSIRVGVKRFVFISSAAVYGNPEKKSIDEDHPTDPLSPYAVSKLKAEEYCRSYSKMGKINMIILRLFNVYGSRQLYNQYSAVITQFINKIKNNQQPIIFGDGEQVRDFIYVGDVVEYISKEIDSDFQGVINIGTGQKRQSISLHSLLQIFIKNL